MPAAYGDRFSLELRVWAISMIIPLFFLHITFGLLLALIVRWYGHPQNVLAQLWEWLQSPQNKVEILAIVGVILQYLQFIFCRLRRRTNHWFVQCGAWVAYYMPIPLAAYAIGMMLHLHYPFLLVALFFAIGQTDTMTAYSLSDDKQGMRRSLQRTLSFAYLLRFSVAFFGALYYMTRLHLLVEITPPTLGFVVFFMGLRVHSRAIHSSDLAKIIVDNTELRRDPKSHFSKRHEGPSSHSNLESFDRNNWSGCNHVIGVGSLESYQSAISGCTTLRDIGMLSPRRFPLLNNICLSSALFHLLVQLNGMPGCAEENLRIIRQLFSEELLGYELYRVIEVQLSFLYDYFFAAHSSSSRTYHSLYFMYSLLKIGFLLSILLSVHSIGVVIEKTEATSMAYGRVGGTVSLVALVILELCQFVSIFASDWFAVSCVCNAARGASHHTVTFSKWWIEKHVHMYILSCKLFGPLYWQNKLGQYSLIKDFDCNTLKQKLMRLLGRPQRGARSSPVGLSNEVMRRFYVKIKSNNGGGENVRPQLQDELSWACSQQTQIHTILMWHIATWYCESNEDEPLGSSEYRVATELSRYCAYLVAFHPELLPGHHIKTTSIFDELLEEAKLNLEGISVDGRYKKMASLQLEDSAGGQGILELGIELGRQLLDTSSFERWEVMADFWAEAMLFVAQSKDAAAHIEQLAKGGEFITHLWAMLSTAGIQQDRNRYFRYNEGKGTQPSCS